MKTGLAHAGIPPETIDSFVDFCVTAEKDGFSTVWKPNIFGHDALTQLLLAGLKTKTIELGTAVTPTYPRHPHALAQQAVTTSAALDGRLALGIGRSHQIVIEGMFGLDYAKPITHMREYVTIVRALAEEGNAAVDGKMYKVNAPLDVADRKPFPILIGALMPKMLELCGELADGTLTWMVGPNYLQSTIVPTMNAAAEKAGRATPRAVVSLPVCVTDDAEAARKIAAELFVIYGTLPVYRACLDAEGAENPAGIALIGNEESVRAGLDRVAEAGATDFYAAIFPDAGGKQTVERTYAALKDYANAG